MSSLAELPPEQRGVQEENSFASFREEVRQLFAQQNDLVDRRLQELENLLGQKTKSNSSSRSPLDDPFNDPKFYTDKAKITGEQAEVSEKERTSEAKFLQAWNNFTPNQKARLWPTIKNTLPIPDDLQHKEYLSVPETTIFLGVSQGRVRTLIREGKLPAVRDPLRRFRIPRNSLESYRPQR